MVCHREPTTASVGCDKDIGTMAPRSLVGTGPGGVGVVAADSPRMGDRSGSRQRRTRAAVPKSRRGYSSVGLSGFEHNRPGSGNASQQCRILVNDGQLRPVGPVERNCPWRASYPRTDPQPGRLAASHTEGRQAEDRQALHGDRRSRVPFRGGTSRDGPIAPSGYGSWLLLWERDCVARKSRLLAPANCETSTGNDSLSR